MKQLFLDIETTGFSREWNEIIELAAVLYDSDRKEMLDSFHMYAKPTRGIPANITELTGITNEKVANCKPEWEMMLMFCDWFDSHHIDAIIGHNCKAFDLQFIKAKSDKYSLHWNGDRINVIDTLAIGKNYNWFNRTVYKDSSICQLIVDEIVKYDRDFAELINDYYVDGKWLDCTEVELKKQSATK